ncbi:MAG: Wzt carbohydrate-binding domain-containing protein, partial [Candidatus Dormiibacterota bacterium]
VMDSVRSVCDRCLWIEHGLVRDLGGVSTVTSAYIADVNRREEEEMGIADTSTIDDSPGRMGVRVTGVEISGPDGPTSVLNTGDPASVSIAFEAPAPLKGARFTISFLRSDGAPILSVPTDDGETGAGTLPRQGVVRLILPGLPFLEGVYLLTVDVTEITTGQHYKRLERVRRFRVHSADHREEGMALLGHSWELPQVGAPAAGR